MEPTPNKAESELAAATTPPVSVPPTTPATPVTAPAPAAGVTPATPTALITPPAAVVPATPAVAPASLVAPAPTSAPAPSPAASAAQTAQAVPVKSDAESPSAKPAAAKHPDSASAAAPDALQMKPDQASSHSAGQGYRNKIIFGLSIIGIIAGLVAAYFFGRERKAQPPVFQPVSSPFETAIYANGIVESDQPSGANINIYPEVTGPITRVLVHEGQQVSAGTPLFTIDDSVPSANRELAAANLKAAHDQYDKRRASYDLDPKSISKDALDTAADAVDQAAAALKVADVLLQKYTLKAPVDGVVLALNTTVGSYVSSQGAYDAYTQGLDPLVVMGAPQAFLAVRCYVDEILISRLPNPWHIQAQLSIRGTDIKVPLEFVRVQPYVSPKIELSNQRQERVDLRVLPVIFRFERKDTPVYPGQLVDVFIGKK
jgi:HlyD family secretion protein